MTEAGGGGGGTKLESGSGSSLKSGQSAADNNKATNEGSQEPQGTSASTMPSGSGGEESTASIFLQTAAYLLDVHALKVHCMLLYFSWCSYYIIMTTLYQRLVLVCIN